MPVNFNELLEKFSRMVIADNVTGTEELFKYDNLVTGEGDEDKEDKEGIPKGLILMDKKTVEIYEQIMQTVFYDSSEIQELFKVEIVNDYYVVKMKTISEVKNVLNLVKEIKDFEYKCALTIGLYKVAQKYHRYLAYKENGELIFTYDKTKYSNLYSDLVSLLGTSIETGDDPSGIFNNSPITYSLETTTISFIGRIGPQWYYTEDNMHLKKEIPTIEEIMFHELVGEMVLGNIGKANESRLKPVQVGNITRKILGKNTFFSGAKHLPRPSDISYSTEYKYVVKVDEIYCYEPEIVKKIPEELAKC